MYLQRMQQIFSSITMRKTFGRDTLSCSDLELVCEGSETWLKSKELDLDTVVFEESNRFIR